MLILKLARLKYANDQKLILYLFLSMPKEVSINMSIAVVDWNSTSKNVQKKSMFWLWKEIKKTTHIICNTSNKEIKGNCCTTWIKDKKERFLLSNFLQQKYIEESKVSLNRGVALICVCSSSDAFYQIGGRREESENNKGLVPGRTDG